MPEHAEGVPAKEIADLAEEVRADPDLSLGERESIIRWDGDRTHATVYTEEKGTMPSLLRSPVARVHELRISDGDRFGVRVTPEEYTGGPITGVDATVPIAAVLLKSRTRNEDKRSNIISDYQGGEPEA